MTVTGFNIVLQAHRAGHDLLHGRNELVAAFLGLELAYLLQVSCSMLPANRSCFKVDELGQRTSPPGVHCEDLCHKLD